MKSTIKNCLFIATTSIFAMQIAPTTEQIQQVVIIGKRMNTIEKAEYDALQKQTKAQWAEASIRASNNLK